MRLLMIISLITLLFVVAFAEGEQHPFSGTKKCKMCHKGEKNNLIFEMWQESKHSHAYETLGSEEAHKLYAELGNTGNPQEDPECLRCHIPGVGLDSTLTLKVVKENGVTCESCHGAGGDYGKLKIMKDRELSISLGLVPEAGKGCVNCHNEEAPTYKGFDYDEMWEKIKHDLPPIVEGE